MTVLLICSISKTFSEITLRILQTEKFSLSSEESTPMETPKLLFLNFLTFSEAKNLLTDRYTELKKAEWPDHTLKKELLSEQVIQEASTPLAKLVVLELLTEHTRPTGATVEDIEGSTRQQNKQVLQIGRAHV